MKNHILKNIELIPESGCWIWMRACDGKGYGLVNIPKTRAVTRAHRASYSEFVGEIPKGMHVLHRCDVTPCCNPAHLFIGTNKDNMADKCAKGRHRNRYTGRLTISSQAANKKTTNGMEG